MKMYFTRLTPNFNDWKQPSGKDGKCKSSNPQKPLYEELNGFGWEEWLFEEYFEHKSDNEFVCKGFVEAYNKDEVSKDKIDRLYLYTKVCGNKQKITPGCYYVGYIDNVTPIKPESKIKQQVKSALSVVGIVDTKLEDMLLSALNITFKVNDVHVCFPKVFERPLELKRCEFDYQFKLFKLGDFPSFSEKIFKYTNH